ncbi:MAG: VWD domain-containing protein, partial [Pseudanabaena sp. ELA748]
KEIFFNIRKLIDKKNNLKELKPKEGSQFVKNLKLDETLSKTNEKRLLISECIQQIIKSAADTANALKPFVNQQAQQTERFIAQNAGRIIEPFIKYRQFTNFNSVGEVIGVIGSWIASDPVESNYIAKTKSYSEYTINQAGNNFYLIANALCVPNLSNTAGNVGKSLLGEVGSLVAAAALIGVTAAVAEWCINNPQGCMLLAKNPGLTAKALIEQLFGKGRSPEQVAQNPNPQPQLQSNGKNKTGSSYGDPHIVTFDGYRYSFQTVGEFTLVKSTDRNFEVQVRQSPVPGAQLSLNSAVAIKSGNSRIAIYGQSLPDSDTSTPIRVDGRPYPAQGGTLPNGTVIAQQGEGSYIIQTTSGEVVSVRKTSRNNLSYMDVNPSIPDVTGRYLGLLGNSNGNPKDDLQTRSGQVIETQSTYGQIAQTASSFIPGVGRIAGLVSKVENIVFDQLYKEFGNSWRISQADSLFDYKAGHTTDTFTDRGFPSSYRTLAMLSPAQVQTATAACQQANVNPEQLEGCIFDVGFTGDSGFAETASQALEIVNTINQLVPNAIPLPKLPVSIPGLPF